MHTDARVEIATFDAQGARAHADDLVRIYAEIYAAKTDDPFFAVERFATRFRAHSSRPAYALVTGGIDGALVGYAYGVPLAADTRWWSGLVEPLPPELVHETGDRTFALNEIMVLELWRRHGIARRLHDALLKPRREQRATLLVESSNTPARSAYAQWGWVRLGQLRPFPDAPLYDSMVLDLDAWQRTAG